MSSNVILDARLVEDGRLSPLDQASRESFAQRKYKSGILPAGTRVRVVAGGGTTAHIFRGGGGSQILAPRSRSHTLRLVGEFVRLPRVRHYH